MMTRESQNNGLAEKGKEEKAKNKEEEKSKKSQRKGVKSDVTS